VLAAFAAGCGTVAAAQVHGTVQEVESRTGAPVPVVVAGRDLPEGTRLSPRRAARALALREVPARYAPRDALAAPEQAVGMELAVPLVAGAYVTAPMLRPPAGDRPAAAPVRRGQRLVEVAVSGGRELEAALAPASGAYGGPRAPAGGGYGGPRAPAGGGYPAADAAARVDVLVSTEGRSGRGRTFVALENVELVAARPAGEQEAAGATGTPPDTVATLRVGARAAVFLTAAQNFAREVRLLARPAGDRGRVGRAEVAGGL
jgi:pilus assembly protein CpaB